MAELEDKGIQLPDVPFNPLRAKAQEGQILIVKKSNPEGPLDGFVHSLKDFHFRWEETVSNPDNWKGSQIDKWDVLPDLDDAGNQIFFPRPKGMLEAELGWTWVGFGRALGKIKIRQAKWEIPKGGTAAQMVNKEREENSIFYHHVLGIVMPDIESKGNFRNTIKLNITVEIGNPYKALYLAGGWESTLDGAIHGAIRDYISEMTADKIRDEKEGEGMANRVKELNGLADGFFEKYGVKIIDVRFVSWDTTNTDKDAQKALVQKETNRLNADAAVEKAREIQTIGDAVAYAAAKLTAAAGSPEAAAQIRAAELIADAIRNTSASVVSIGGMSVPVTVPVPPKRVR